MNRQLFKSLSPLEATELLEAFLHTGRSNCANMAAAADAEGVLVDYSVSSVPIVLRWLLSMVQTVGRPEDKALPDWIRSSRPYRSDLFDFDDPSKDLVLQGGFYLGESFVRSFERLSWDVGEPGFVQENMPVVKGFKHGDEMPALLVVNNLFRRVLVDPGRLSDIEKMVKFWSSRAGPGR
jgi:hypothetical protein